MYEDQMRRPSVKGDASMGGTPSFAPAVPALGPSPSPTGYAPHFAPPRPGPAPPAPVQLVQPGTQPMHSPGPMPPTPQHYPSQSYPTQFAPSPAPMGHHPMPNHMGPAYDHRQMAPSHAALATPQRPPMQPMPNTTAIPHANATPGPGGIAYNPPRAVETYTLPDAVDAQIPPEVRRQFHTDDQGRVVFHTVPPLHRAHPGVASEHVGLGHSMRYMSDMQQFREDRKRKREVYQREQDAARKRAAAEHVEQQRAAQDALVERAAQGLLGWVADMDRGTKILQAGLGGWDLKQMKAKERAEADKKAAEKPAGDENAAPNGSQE